MLSLFLFFFFKQKTAYEMRISDWSSDVCSSDLPADVREILTLGLAGIALSRYAGVWVAMKTIAEVVESAASFDLPDPRSEERRVGKSVSVRVDLGGRRIIKKKKKKSTEHTPLNTNNIIQFEEAEKSKQIP